MKVVYEIEASLELQEAVAWYLEHAGERQAEALIRDLNARLALVMRFPLSGTPGIQDTRSMPLRLFPYTVHYRAEEHAIRIFAVAHQKRRPGYWRKR